MKIQSSAISMSSQREYNYYEQKTSASLITTADEAALLDFSKEGVSLMEQMQEKQLQIEADEKERDRQQEQNMLNSFVEHMKRMREQEKVAEPIEDELNWKIKLMRKILDILNGKGDSEEYSAELKKLRNEYKGKGAFRINTGSEPVSTGGAASPTRWTKTTVESAFITEREMTAFEAVGYARTADGREIEFGVTLEMSRAFCAQYESLVQESYIVTDPLVINLDTNVASVTDQKFLFDLDSDGETEQISFTGEGSGFLAIDKNGDGIINDGSELFGTQSGDGFKDLSSYDEDSNGWIDENDKVFDNLKVWAKASDGTDILMTLKDADVGAIYLGNASTEYSLKNAETNSTNGIIRQTGVYLKESGGVSTIQHVDLAV
ncbi:MAG: hypothetical protein E7266_03350 [Lachnospiraceae bacterium]|nr:hypothetical protein [Lachnospiraceae bacterium]